MRLCSVRAPETRARGLRRRPGERPEPLAGDLTGVLASLLDGGKPAVADGCRRRAGAGPAAGARKDRRGRPQLPQHADESSEARPAEPRSSSRSSPPRSPARRPDRDRRGLLTERVDWEVELGVVIGASGCGTCPPRGARLTSSDTRSRTISRRGTSSSERRPVDPRQELRHLLPDRPGLSLPRTSSAPGRPSSDDDGQR